LENIQLLLHGELNSVNELVYCSNRAGNTVALPAMNRFRPRAGLLYF